jgi:hypothetical protein
MLDLDLIRQRQGETSNVRVSAVDAEDRDDALETLIRWIGIPNVSILQDPYSIQGTSGTVYHVHTGDEFNDVPTSRRRGIRFFHRYYSEMVEHIRRNATTEQERKERIEIMFETSKQL